MFFLLFIVLSLDLPQFSVKPAEKLEIVKNPKNGCSNNISRKNGESQIEKQLRVCVQVQQVVQYSPWS